MEILETREYRLFKDLRGQNPKRAEANAKELVPSLLRTGGNIVPIVINNKGQIIDGYTRLLASEIAGTPIRYIKINGSAQAARQTMIEINTHQKSWTMMEFIHFYAQNNVVFQGILKTLKRSPLKTAATLDLLGISSKMIKTGEVKSANYERYNALVNHVDAAIDASSGRLGQGPLSRAFTSLYDYGTVDFNVLIDKIEVHYDSVAKEMEIKKPAGKEITLEFLQRCYNRRRASEDKVRIFPESL